MFTRVRVPTFCKSSTPFFVWLSAISFLGFGMVAHAQDVLQVVSDGVGIYTSSVSADLHILESDPNRHNRIFVKLQGTSFAPQFEYTDGATNKTWRIGMNPSDDFVINQTDDLAVGEMKITADGHVYVNNTQVHPDYVFNPDYKLMGLNELQSYVEKNRHLPGLASSDESKGETDLSSFPLDLLKKIEELTLYTIQQQHLLERQQTENESLRADVQQLKTQLAQLQDRLDNK